MRLTLCLEGNTEGRVLASVDMEEIVKMTITDDIEKSNLNPKMLKSATDLAYQCGYQQGRADAIDELKNKIVYHLNDYALQEAPIYQDDDDVANQRPVYLAIKNCINGVIEVAERLKEKNK